MFSSTKLYNPSLVPDHKKVALFNTHLPPTITICALHVKVLACGIMWSIICRNCQNVTRYGNCRGEWVTGNVKQRCKWGGPSVSRIAKEVSWTLGAGLKSNDESDGRYLNLSEQGSWECQAVFSLLDGIIATICWQSLKKHFTFKVHISAAQRIFINPLRTRWMMTDKCKHKTMTVATKGEFLWI